MALPRRTMAEQRENMKMENGKVCSRNPEAKRQSEIHCSEKWQQEEQDWKECDRRCLTFKI